MFRVHMVNSTFTYRKVREFQTIEEAIEFMTRFNLEGDMGIVASLEAE